MKKKYELLGRYFIFRGWPEMCIHIWEDGRLCFGNIGNWDRNITVDSHPEPLSDSEILEFAQTVYNANNESNFNLWLDSHEYIQKLWKENK